MPPMVQAEVPGSTGKNSPRSRRWVFSCSRVTPASTRQSMSGWLTSSTRFIRDRSSVMPPRTGVTWPSSDVPAPHGTTGTRSAWHSAISRHASSVVSMNATASGITGGWLSWPCEWWSRSAALVVMRSPRKSRAAAIRVSTGMNVSRWRICDRIGPGAVSWQAVIRWAGPADGGNAILRRGADTAAASGTPCGAPDPPVETTERRSGRSAMASLASEVSRRVLRIIVSDMPLFLQIDGRRGKCLDILIKPTGRKIRSISGGRCHASSSRCITV